MSRLKYLAGGRTEVARGDLALADQCQQRGPCYFMIRVGTGEQEEQEKWLGTLH